MEINDVYNECPILKNDVIFLKSTNIEDAEELLKCYSDKKAVPLFNSDNCHGDNFFYETIEKMKQAIEFWEFSYKNKYFVRWTVILNTTNEKIGTIEMFNRDGENGVLRIDLQSKYEIDEVIEAIILLADQHFYELFHVKKIFTKAVPSAKHRIAVLKKWNYKLADKSILEYSDYYFK